MKALPDRRSIRRILILKWSALGDVAMASAIMEDIRRAFPQARIDLDTLPAAAGLFAHDPRFERVLTIDSRAPGQRLRMTRAWLHSVHAGRYDLLIDLQGSDHTRGLVALAWLTGCGIRHRWGLRPGWPFTLAPRGLARDAYAVTRMRALLARATSRRRPRFRFCIPRPPRPRRRSDCCAITDCCPRGLPSCCRDRRRPAGSSAGAPRATRSWPVCCSRAISNASP